MKTFKASIVLSILFLAASSLVAQGDTLTIRQIFDLKVGDTLIYSGYEDISALTEHAGPQYAYYGRWGFTIIQKDTTTDSITYTYQVLGSGINQQLAVYFLDSSIQEKKVFFSYQNNDPNYKMFNWLGGGVSLYQVLTCDSAAIVLSCDIYLSIDSLFQNRVVNQTNGRYFEGGATYTFIDKVGIFEAEVDGDNYFFPTSINSAIGSGFIQLVYYHSDSTIWMDTTDYILSGVNEISPTQTNFKISPNPSTGEFYLEAMSANRDNNGVIKIYDLQSRLIYQDKIQITNHKQSINIPNASAGLYIISVENPTQGIIWRGRLVKQ